MSNSPLVSYTKISPNRTSPRTHKIDTITIHCYVGQVSVENAGAWFEKPTTQASCNYVIGTDGRIGLIVDEGDRSWCSSNAPNDHRAITIECASDKTDPYAINDKVYSSLIKLCADICKRNDIKELKWKGDKSLIGQVDKQNMTVHRWFKNKACPGDYIYNRLGKIAAEVNELLGSGSAETNPEEPVPTYPAVPFEVGVLVKDLNYRDKPSMDGAVKGVTGVGIFTIVEVSGNWGKLKSGAGWIYLANPEYVSLGKKFEIKPEDKSFLVQVEIDNLNIRTGPGTNNPTTGKYTGVGVFTIVETSTGQGSTKGWGKLKSGGWISLDFAEKI